MVASNRLSGSHENHVVPIPGSEEKVLRTAVLYGANGAGKSNIFKALEYVKKIALEQREKNSGTGRDAFRFSARMDEPSSFDLQFIAEDKLYRFGFKTNDLRIIEEWLVRVDGGREKSVYERVTDESGKVKVELQDGKTTNEKLKALATVGGPQNQSFLATIFVLLDSFDYGEELSTVLSWFKSKLNLIAPTDRFLLSRFLLGDSHFNQFASGFLKSCSTGIDHLRVQKHEITEDEFRRSLPEELVTQMLRQKGGGSLVPVGDGEVLLVEHGDQEHFFLLTIRAAHESSSGKIIPLDLSEESDGTRRLLHLVPALHQPEKQTAVYFIDEIDRSLHPILVWNFLDFFLKSREGSQHQIIVTTHESNLLDLDLLRRDEIWFVEKNQEGATRLYSLADFKVRKDLEIRKHYLQGRFGAVPFLGNLDRLLEPQDKSE
ncbi:MAG TPA: ATP-binding protein [Candidatus Angelobacter sp.]|nr:ATP-binding protein [Candidatus Angelobacter sp.]